MKATKFTITAGGNHQFLCPPTQTKPKPNQTPMKNIGNLANLLSNIESKMAIKSTHPFVSTTPQVVARPAEWETLTNEQKGQILRDAKAAKKAMREKRNASMKARYIKNGVKPVMVEVPVELLDTLTEIATKRDTSRMKVIVNCLLRGTIDMVREQELVEREKRILSAHAKPPLPKNMAMVRDQHRLRMKGILPPHNLTARKGKKK